MILTTFSEFSFYAKLNPHFEKAAHWLLNTDLHLLPMGRNDIDGDNIFGIRAKMPARTAETAKLEAHRQYIDLQICLEGMDHIQWKDLRECPNISDPYDEEKDLIFFADKAEQAVRIHDDKMAIFFPHDAHAPLVGEGILDKLVVKVACD
jgi:YhcH/YjgK/YiaL family protein